MSDRTTVGEPDIIGDQYGLLVGIVQATLAGGVVAVAALLRYPMILWLLLLLIPYLGFTRSVWMLWLSGNDWRVDGVAGCLQHRRTVSDIQRPDRVVWREAFLGFPFVEEYRVGTLEFWSGSRCRLRLCGVVLSDDALVRIENTASGTAPSGQQIRSGRSVGGRITHNAWLAALAAASLTGMFGIGAYVAFDMGLVKWGAMASWLFGVAAFMVWIAQRAISKAYGWTEGP